MSFQRSSDSCFAAKLLLCIASGWVCTCFRSSINIFPPEVAYPIVGEWTIICLTFGMDVTVNMVVQDTPSISSVPGGWWALARSLFRRFLVELAKNLSLDFATKITRRPTNNRLVRETNFGSILCLESIGIMIFIAKVALYLPCFFWRWMSSSCATRDNRVRAPYYTPTLKTNDRSRRCSLEIQPVVRPSLDP